MSSVLQPPPKKRKVQLEEKEEPEEFSSLGESEDESTMKEHKEARKDDDKNDEDSAKKDIPKKKKNESIDERNERLFLEYLWHYFQNGTDNIPTREKHFRLDKSNLRRQQVRDTINRLNNKGWIKLFTNQEGNVVVRLARDWKRKSLRL